MSTAATTTTTATTTVLLMICFFEGHTTFFISLTVSRKNLPMRPKKRFTPAKKPLDFFSVLSAMLHVRLSYFVSR